MYKIVFISIFTLFTGCLFAQSGQTNNKTKRALTAKNTNPASIAVEDERSRIKSPEELWKWIFSAAPLATSSVATIGIQSKSISDVMPKPSPVRLASDQPREEKKPEAPKELPKPGNQGQ